MNKGKVRDNGELKYKRYLIDRILESKGIPKNSEYARRLKGKTGGELAKILKGEA